jgi:hypothetical protein
LYTQEKQRVGELEDGGVVVGCDEDAVDELDGKDQ